MKKFTQSYSQLSKIILEMSEGQQAKLLKIAKKIIDGRGDSNYNFKKYRGNWLISLGVLSGWLLAVTVLITLFKNI